MKEALSFLLLPFAASIAFVLIHAYLGVHVLRRKVVFADLALAQLSECLRVADQPVDQELPRGCDAIGIALQACDWLPSANAWCLPP